MQNQRGFFAGSFVILTSCPEAGGHCGRQGEEKSGNDRLVDSGAPAVMATNEVKKAPGFVKGSPLGYQWKRDSYFLYLHVSEK